MAKTAVVLAIGAILIAGCSSSSSDSHAVSASHVDSWYTQTPNPDDATKDTVLVETIAPVTMVQIADDPNYFPCLTLQRNPTQAQTAGHATTTLPAYVTLRILAEDVNVDGDRVSVKPNGDSSTEDVAFTDDNHAGEICDFQFPNLRVYSTDQH